jgi:putative transcriptional regulator
MTHHPHFDLIKKYAIGELTSPLAVMLSAHLETCQDCRLTYNEIVKQEAVQLDQFAEEMSESELDSAFNSLIELTAHAPAEVAAEPLDRPSINVSDQVVELPKSMRFLKDQIIPWKEFGKKNAIAPVSTSEYGQFYVIYIGPGESVPQHDHTGLEYSYVVAGSYNDGISNFETGDFAVSSNGYSHSPAATSDDGCLVISWVEGRLNFFQGILKPLNPLLWWYLHRA